MKINSHTSKTQPEQQSLERSTASRAAMADPGHLENPAQRKELNTRG